MGAEYTLARHDDKKLYDLGKSGWSLVCGERAGGMAGFSSEGYSPDVLDFPKSSAELWQRVWKWHNTDGFENTTEVQATLKYIDLLVADLWEFISKGTRFSCVGDGSDDQYEWMAAGYEYVGSRYYLGTPEHDEEMQRLAQDCTEARQEAEANR